MSHRYVMSSRNIRNGAFGNEPGRTRYLAVPAGELPTPKHEIDQALWTKRLRRCAVWGKDARQPRFDRGDLLVFVHGYNNDMAVVMQRHDLLIADLHAAGFKGELMSYDWPSADSALNYLEDRHDAKRTAMQLVSDGIHLLAEQQSPECTINVHLLGHSTGAYVIREAFDDADDSRLPNNAWTVSQVVFIGGDISSNSLREGNATTDSLYRHCVRLTNYSNLGDSVLKLSNAKRLGVAPRVGRIGLPDEAPDKAVDVDCSDYFAALTGDAALLKKDQAKQRPGSFDHSWHIGNRVFARDLFETLRGDLDRHLLPTRERKANGRLKLVRPA